MYLESTIWQEAIGIEELRLLHDERPSQPRNLFEGTSGLKRARFARVQWPSGDLTYSQVEGDLVNATALTSKSVTIGLIESGSALVGLGSQSYKLKSGEAMLFLPGDDAIQLLQNSSQFSLRCFINQAALFRLEALPFQRRAEVGRKLSTKVAADFGSLFRYFCEEFDRASEPKEKSHQIEVLTHALVSRTIKLLDDVIGGSPTEAQSMLQCCLAAKSYIDSHLFKRSSTAELASIASCSVRNLQRAFELVAEMTPAMFEYRVRLNYARALIVGAGLQGKHVSLVSKQCGFSSPSRFASAYEAEFLETPHETMIRTSDLIKRFVKYSLNSSDLNQSS